MATLAMKQDLNGTPDVERAAARLARPTARVGLAVKRLLDVALALVMLVAVAPLLLLALALLAAAGDGWFERQMRLGRHGRPVALPRLRPLPGGGFGQALGRAGVRELPLLAAIVRGRLSFVGPRLTAPGSEAGHTGPRRLMAPGLIGPAQRGGFAASGDELDDAYVQRWSLLNDARLLLGRRPKLHQSVSNKSS